MRHHLRGPNGPAVRDPPAMVSHRAASLGRDSGCSSSSLQQQSCWSILY